MAELQGFVVPRVSKASRDHMGPERWLQVRDVLAGALDVAPADRPAVLDRACSSDPLLRSDLDEVLPTEETLHRLYDLPMATTLATIVRAGDEREPASDAPPLAAGTKIGPYQIIRVLGSGGMGRVYLARDARLERVVALKLVVRGLGDDPVARAHVLREARAAAGLTHPGIAQVYDVIDHHGAVVMVMEYVEGTSLRDRLLQGPLDVEESVRVCLTIADALAHAHAAGVIHCDIKPGNIQLPPAGGVKILDFGLARRVVATSADTTESRAGVAGTPGYMSPEQALGHALDERSDLFSLGVVLFEMLSGTRPYNAGGPRWFDAVFVLLTNKPDYSRLGPDTPVALRDVLVRALQWEPAARFQHAGEFQQALRDVLRGIEPQTPTAPTPAPAPSPRRWSRRAAIGVTVAVLTLAGLAGAAWRVAGTKTAATISPLAERWYVDGLGALQEGAYLQASRALERAVQIDPAHALSWARLGEAQLELDQEPRAGQSVLESRLARPRPVAAPRRRTAAARSCHGHGATRLVHGTAGVSALAKIHPKSAPILVDLGRVYQAAEAMPKAVAHYLQATQIDDQNPAPFLRMGILYGRSGDPAAAEAAFKRAEELYAARSRVEGVATVSYERGVMLDRSERLAEASAALERALQLADSVDSAYLRAAVLFKLSGVAGAQGRYDDAEKHARDGLRISEGFEGLNAFGLVDLGNVFAYRGQLKTAEQHFRTAVDRADRSGARRSQARARLALASLLMATGSLAEAIAEARAAFTYYDQTGFTALRARALTLLARGEERLGNLTAAQASYEALLASAVATGNERQVAEQHDSLSRFLLRREFYVVALRHGDESLTRFRSLKAPYDIARGTVLHADILWQMGRLDDADRELDAMFGRDSGMGAATTALERSRALGRARVLLARNDNARAAAIARRALAAPPADLSAALRGELQRVVVLALARGGRAAEAVSLMEAASNAAVESADRHAIAQAALAKAEVLLRLRRYDEALTAAGPLADQLAADERHESAWLAARLAAQAATALGRTDAVARWQALADAERAHFIAQFDAAGLRLYESRPDLKPWL